MTTLIQRLASAPDKRPPAKSVMDVWIETLTEPEREAVLKAALSPAWGHVALRDTLAAEGAPRISDNAFGAWRRKIGWTA